MIPDPDLHPVPANYPSPLNMPRKRVESDVRPPSWSLGTDTGWYITTHALERARLKGFTEQQILDVLQNPAVRYPRRDGQVRYVGGTDPAIVLVVVEKHNLVVTLHHHKVETPEWDYQKDGRR